MDYDFNDVVEDVNVVPEKYRSLYVETDEGFKLDDRVTGLVNDYRGVANTLKGTLAAKKAANGEAAQRRLEMKAIQDLAAELGVEGDNTADALRSHINELVSKVKGGESVRVDIEKVKADFDRRLNSSLSEKDNELKGMHSSLVRHMIDSEASRALAANKASVDLLMPHIKSMADVVRDGDGNYVVVVKDNNGDVRLGTNGGMMSINDLVAEMKVNPSFAPAFPSEAPSGSGARPGAASAARKPSQAPMNSTQKISAGLQKGQFRRGR